MTQHQLVVGTTNRGKLREIRELLSELPIVVLSVSDVLSQPLDIVEDGETFADNAIIKARAIAEATCMMTIADDSGLEVDQLRGAPGVRSARFAHVGATDAENNAALLTALEGEGDAGPVSALSPFTARFRCSVALVDPFADGDDPVVVEGSCEGRITRTPRGSFGFGYDPLFVVRGVEKTMAELSAAEKHEVSHRGKAIRALIPIIVERVHARDAVIDRVMKDERA